LKMLKESGVRVIACTEKTDQLIYKSDLTGPVAILMGSEEDGISPELLEMADEKVMIPMFGQIESLNISVAASVCLYECVRQRNGY
jgi:23S rRNA (guanosine2251-2'-O)-methyltransferase